MNQPWLRAGLIGAGVVIIINLLGLIPGVGVITLPLMFVALAGVGTLAASFMAPRREVGRGAAQGALAGLMAGLAGGIVYAIMFGTSMSALGGAQGFVAQLPPQLMEQYRQMGVDPAAIFTSGLLTTFVALCCFPTSLIAGALLGALGGTIYAVTRPE